ncbi:MAG TPA: glycosyltransferase [Thermoanaerobaculia bacterium]|nr:glycosyltransferase [Thermoanaerobaculia bacterium]
MRVLHILPTYLPATRYGGPIFAVHGLCRALVARGHEVDVFTTNVDGRGVSDVPVGEAVVLDGVRVTYFASPVSRLYWSPGMARALAASVRNYDLVHVHSIYLWPTLAAARAARAARVPYVISPRGMLVRDLIRRKSRVVKSAWLRLVERRNFEHAAAIHFTAQREWDDARATGMPLPQPFVVPNGIDLVPRPNVPRDPHTIVSLGRINWKKGLDRLIAALPAEAKLIIAGNDEENLTPRLRELARGRDVEFRGPVYGDAKWELLARAAAFALPSLSENFGNVVLEAMLMETPVVVTPEVGVADAVAAANAGIVTNDLGAALAEILRDPRDYGRNGRALVESQFTWPVIAARMEEAYRCSIASRPSS